MCVWDVRQSRKSQELLGPRSLSQLCQVQVCPDGHVVIAGAPSGHVSARPHHVISCPTHLGWHQIALLSGSISSVPLTIRALSLDWGSWA